jgi:Tfp pilus assembly pilus retraction ATPase PilT
MAKIARVLGKVAAIKASDVHIVADNPPMFRHLGESKKFKTKPLFSTFTKAFIYEILAPKMQKKFKRDLKLGFCHEMEDNKCSTCR